jgi:ATP-binding cassette subfamily B protein
MGESDHSAPLARLWRYARPYRGWVIRATTWSALNKVFDLAPPLLIGVAIDVVVEQENSVLADWFDIEDPRAQLVVLAAITFVVWGLESLFEYLQGVDWRSLAQQVQHRLRMDTYRHIQGLDMPFFEERRSGDLLAVLNDDINQLERFLDTGANTIIQLLTTVTLIGALFFFLAPQVAWLAFLPIPIIVWGSFAYQRRLEPKYAKVRDQAGALNSQLASNLGGMATIKSFTAEDREAERIEEESEAYQAANRNAITLSSAFSPLIRIGILTGFTVMLIGGGFMVLDGTLRGAAYVTMVFMIQRLLWPLTLLGQTMDQYQRAMASTNRILNVLDTTPDITDGLQSLPLDSVEGSITYEGVSFAYEAGYPVLRDVSFEIRAGATTAFVGATGSGKTTIVKLLLRFYDVDSGSLRLDGYEVSDLQVGDLRRAIALVSQDVFLFHGTVAANIAYGRPEASFEEVRAAAEVAEADEFITQLPERYETIVGERGQKLSGGQRQRISIARAVLAQSPVLVLDEATSSVDNETEAAIQRSLERISLERTTIVIAHRLSTIRHADQIHVLEDGKITESGTHDELLATKGLYAALWNVQTGEAVPWHVG